MDYFEELDNKEKEKLEEEKYQEIYQKQSKATRIALLSVCLPMGLIFIILGICFVATSGAEEAEWIVFLSCGLLFSALGLICFFAIPKKGNYQKYKTMVKRRGGLNLFDLSISVGLLEERIESLEQENQSLKRKVKELERNTR